MGLFGGLISKLQQLQTNLALSKLVNDNKDKIVELNKEQLLEGKRNDNSLLPGYKKNNKSKSYKGKAVNKSKGEPIKLFDTGDFYNSMDVKISSGAFTITGDTQKANTDLAERYGKGILGLTPESMDKLKVELRKEVLNKLRQNI